MIGAGTDVSIAAAHECGQNPRKVAKNGLATSDTVGVDLMNTSVGGEIP
jgi:hypothetical protein